ncbi:MAG: hypothetical protein ACPGJS_08485 [Flammeovirgaceae bacterium]
MSAHYQDQDKVLGAILLKLKNTYGESKAVGDFIEFGRHGEFIKADGNYTLYKINMPLKYKLKYIMGNRCFPTFQDAEKFYQKNLNQIKKVNSIYKR